MEDWPSTLYVSVVTKLEQCSSCMTIRGPYGSGENARFDLVLKDSLTNSIIMCPGCKRDKNKSILDQ